MNSVKIEKRSISELKSWIAEHDLLDEYINDNDKEPSWDGYIMVYTDEDLKAEHIKYKIPVQVKGKCKNELINRKMITYPVEYRHLQNYYFDGGVVYFVIAISEDAKRKTIFANALTPVKLKELLKSAEKKPNQTKNIPLQRLKDVHELYILLLQYGHDSKRQGTGQCELMRKTIDLSKLRDIDKLEATVISANSEKEALKKIFSGEVGLFGHLEKSDIWLPVEYSQQIRFKVRTVRCHDELVKVDGIEFYKRFRIEEDDESIKIIFSDNLYIKLTDIGYTMNLALNGTVESLRQDVLFMKALLSGHILQLGKMVEIEIHSDAIGNDFLEGIKITDAFTRACEQFDVRPSKKMKDYTEQDWKKMQELTNLYHGYIIPKDGDIAWHMWWWENKLYPFIVYRENNKVRAINIFKDDKCVTEVKFEEKKYRVPVFASLNRDIWSKLYDVREQTLIKQIEQSDINMETAPVFISIFIELMWAYDDIQNEKYYNAAFLIIEKLIELDNDNVAATINRMQLIYRKRELAEEEMRKLEAIDDQDYLAKCAANILLDNKRIAKKYLEKMSEEDKNKFKQNPIYNLL